MENRFWLFYRIEISNDFRLELFYKYIIGKRPDDPLNLQNPCHIVGVRQDSFNSKDFYNNLLKYIIKYNIGPCMSPAIKRRMIVLWYRYVSNTIWDGLAALEAVQLARILALE